MKQLRTVAVLPALLTLGNLICGFFAIVVASRIEAPQHALVESVGPIDARKILLIAESDPTNVMLSGWLIFLAMIFDVLDGQVARMSNTSSDFGVQLDSLCDLVTFGVAPGILMVKMCPNFTYLHQEAVWMIAAAFAACAALRLARFNVETDENDDHLQFYGLPVPAAAASIASFAIMFYTLRNQENPLASTVDIRAIQALLPFYGFVVALFMVSRIPYPHVVNQIFSGRRSFAHVVSVLIALVAIMTVRGYALPIVCGAFVLSGPLRYIWHAVIRRGSEREPLF